MTSRDHHSRRVAKGEERNMSAGATASDMMELTWSDELARGAQLWANQCKVVHDDVKTCK